MTRRKFERGKKDIGPQVTRFVLLLVCIKRTLKWKGLNLPKDRDESFSCCHFIGSIYEKFTGSFDASGHHLVDGDRTTRTSIIANEDNCPGANGATKEEYSHLHGHFRGSAQCRFTFRAITS